MSETHGLCSLIDALETSLAKAGDPAAAGMSGLADMDLEDLASRGWQVMQQIQGMVVVPAVAEADQRKLHKTTRYEGASSMRDLISGWLHCDPPVAGKLLKVGKHCVNGPFTATAAALAAGTVEVDHAAKVVSAVRRLPPIIDRDQRLEAETSMISVAKTTTPEVTNKTGYRLMELIAPHEAADYMDRKAERERLRAEEARWWEITTTPVAGCKELRLRLETSTMNTLSRLVESLTQPAVTDPAGGGGHDAQKQDGDGSVELPTGEPALPAGGAPGDPTHTASCLPLERRRADAMAELIHAMAQPHPADELDPAQLRRLADHLETDGATGTDTGDDEEDGGGQILIDTCDNQDQEEEQGQRQGSVVIPAQRVRSNTAPAAQAADTSSREAKRFRGERASLIVITNYDHALRQYRAGEATAPGAPTPATLSPTDVQVMECEAMVTPVWMTENQTPVSVASSNRYFRGKPLAALIARDRGCVFPGCSRGLRYAHAHHILPVSKGGKTKVDNGVLLCSTHHRLIHTDKSWKVRLAEDRLPEFIPPYHVDPSRTPQRHVRHELRLPVAA